MMSSLQHNLLRGIVKHTFIIFLQQCARLLLHRVWTTMLLVAIKRVWIKLLHCLNLARNVLVQVVTAVQQVVLQLRRAIPNLLWVVRFYIYIIFYLLWFVLTCLFLFFNSDQNQDEILIQPGAIHRAVRFSLQRRVGETNIIWIQMMSSQCMRKKVYQTKEKASKMRALLKC